MRALKQKQYELMAAAVNFSFMLILKETEQKCNELNDDEENRGRMKQNEFQLQLHSLCVQPHSNCLETQSLYLPLVQHFQLEIVKVI